MTQHHLLRRVCLGVAALATIFLMTPTVQARTASPVQAGPTAVPVIVSVRHCALARDLDQPLVRLHRCVLARDVTSGTMVRVHRGALARDLDKPFVRLRWCVLMRDL